jgi:hypothetical protein
LDDVASRLPALDAAVSELLKALEAREAGSP